MGDIALRRMRKWVLALTIFNFLITIGWYCYVGYIIIDRRKQGYAEAPLLWGDWALIVTSIIFLSTFIYSLRSQPQSGRIYKILRAFLLLIPVGIILYLRFKLIVFVANRSPNEYEGSPFECTISDDWTCYVINSMFFINLITAIFIFFEIGMTLAWGPLQKSHQFGSAGYTQGANVILVSPETPQAYYAHGGGAYYPQMAQQQPQQPVLLNYQNSNYKVDENPYLQQQPYPVLYQQPQQQQPYPPSPQSNTQPSPQQRHSFQQQPSPQPYPQYSPQPQPQPSPGGYISQADQYELIQQQQQLQQQQQQQQIQHQQQMQQQQYSFV